MISQCSGEVSPEVCTSKRAEIADQGPKMNTKAFIERLGSYLIDFASYDPSEVMRRTSQFCGEDSAQEITQGLDSWGMNDCGAIAHDLRTDIDLINAESLTFEMPRVIGQHL